VPSPRPRRSAGDSAPGARDEGSRPPRQVVDRTAPHNLDAEEGLLAACLLEPGDVVTLCVDAKLKEEAFFKPAHQLLFRAIIELYEKAAAIDEITVADVLGSRGELEVIGGPVEISRLASRIETTAHARHWLEIVRSKWFLRRLIRTSAHVIEQCHERQDRIDHFLDQVEKQIFELSQDRVTDSAQPIRQSVEAAAQLIQHLISRSGEMDGIETGFTDLDKMTFGLHRQEMVVLAARPSMGKTSLAMNIAEAAVLPAGGRPGHPTLVFSLEMSAEQLALRLLCCRARVNMKRIRDAMLSKEDHRALANAGNELKQAPLWIDDSGSLTILELRAKARRLHSRNPLGLVVVDYLQLLSASDPSMPREQAISEISRGMKALAKELAVPVLVLSQLNRAAEKDNRAPRLSDLRESGAIEQDADVVLLLAPRNEGNDAPQVAQAAPARDLIIAKQRNGPVGTVPLTFVPEYTRFENYRSPSD